MKFVSLTFVLTLLVFGCTRNHEKTGSLDSVKKWEALSAEGSVNSTNKNGENSIYAVVVGMNAKLFSRADTASGYSYVERGTPILLIEPNYDNYKYYSYKVKVNEKEGHFLVKDVAYNTLFDYEHKVAYALKASDAGWCKLYKFSSDFKTELDTLDFIFDKLRSHVFKRNDISLTNVDLILQFRQSFEAGSGFENGYIFDTGDSLSYFIENSGGESSFDDNATVISSTLYLPTLVNGSLVYLNYPKPINFDIKDIGVLLYTWRVGSQEKPFRDSLVVYKWNGSKLETKPN